MRKQLGILTSLVFLGVSALLWTGCSNSHGSSDYCEPSAPICAPSKPICPPVCKPCSEPCKTLNSCRPVCEPQSCAVPQKATSKPAYPLVAQEHCPPKCAAPLKQCKAGPVGECSTNGVTVKARNPKMCILGDQYPLDLEISTSCDVCEVILTTTLPEGVTYLRSQPEAKVDGRNVVWSFGSMNRGQTVPARIWLKSEREGDLCTCFCVKATPVAYCALLCAKPVLVCEKHAPAEVGPNEPINYTITVTNIGTCPAEDVVITDNIPDGLEHASGQKTLNFKLGTLEPCQTKKVNFCLTTCHRGNFCNTAVVTACNANQTSCEACTCVACCQVECQKVGPKEVPVGQNADYQITVVNTGDKSLHEVVVTDTAPSATSIVTASGANINGKQAIWKLKELKAGEKATFNATLTTCTPGYFVNRVNVTNCEGCNSSCEFGTNWKGRPALDVGITNSDNPICVGETSRFKVIVTNKGQEYDTNVNVVVNFPSELTPVNASGASAAQLKGQTVTFAPFPNLAPRQTLEYYITVKANSRGDLRPKVQVSSDFIKNPITQEESLIVN
ncbi:DUF11 domain-containing protein [Candidatus Protochlamydia amoebophila]|uniref:60 kDa outer membrane protein n=1 Tax=Protochlamydia amoebophila (strain UWE25) TaxID=264201 RepID=Q6MDK9_PARUW|nr:DUF11 domain-containing protein [Candidatus Protochlamydia amoebophila]CAF23340.1 unnamed protein product [Candidatus Protochlamydia amoebophila UWE25]